MSRRRTNDARSRDDIDAGGDVTVSFTPLSTDQPAADDDVTIEYYRLAEKRVPFKEICFAGLLFVLGTGCLTLSALIALGVMDSSLDDRMWPTLVLGVLMDLPGVYYMGMVLCVVLRVPGWTWSRLPQFN